MSSPINEQSTKLQQIQKACSEILGKLKGRKITLLNANSYLNDVLLQIGKMHNLMIKNFEEAKNSSPNDQSPEVEKFNLQLSEVEQKIGGLGKILEEAQDAKEDLRENESESVLDQIALLQSKMGKLDLLKRGNIESRLIALRDGNSPEYKDQLYAAINNSHLPRDERLRLVIEHVSSLAFEPARDDVLLDRRGDKRFEDWLGKWFAESGNGKMFVMGLREAKKYPPFVKPLAEILDNEILLEIRKMQTSAQFNKQKTDELGTLIEYIELRCIDKDFMNSPLADECLIRAMLSNPESKKAMIDSFMQFEDVDRIIAEDVPWQAMPVGGPGQDAEVDDFADAEIPEENMEVEEFADVEVPEENMEVEEFAEAEVAEENVTDSEDLDVFSDSDMDESKYSTIEVIRRAKGIEGLKLDPELKFIDFLIDCTVEELHSPIFDRQLEAFAKKTEYLDDLDEHLDRLLPMYLLPNQLRANLMNAPVQPDQNAYSMLIVSKRRICEAPFRNAVIERIGNILSTNVRTPLNMAIAKFVLAYAELLELNEDNPLLQQANRILSKGFGKMA